MSNKYLKMMMFIEENFVRKPITSKIFYTINKKPIELAPQSRTGEVVKFVEEQMEQYNFQGNTKKVSNRETFLKTQIDEKVNNDMTLRLNKLTLNLQKQLTYPQLQNLSGLLAIMSLKQKQINRKHLQRIQNKIIYFIKANLIKQTHVLESAKRVVDQITALLSKKSRQIY